MHEKLQFGNREQIDKIKELERNSIAYEYISWLIEWDFLPRQAYNIAEWNKDLNALVGFINNSEITGSREVSYGCLADIRDACKNDSVTRGEISTKICEIQKKLLELAEVIL
jgi:hypothetical protein